MTACRPRNRPRLRRGARPPLPHSVETERAVLGAILLTGGRALSETGALAAHDFYRPGHEYLFALLARMFAAGEPIDLVTVPELVGRDADRYGGLAYVVELADHVPATVAVGHYARTVHDLAVARRLLCLLDEAREAITGARWKKYALTPQQVLAVELLSGVDLSREEAIAAFGRVWPKPGALAVAAK
jgi:hypothetical protein